MCDIKRSTQHVQTLCPRRHMRHKSKFHRQQYHSQFAITPWSLNMSNTMNLSAGPPMMLHNRHMRQTNRSALSLRRRRRDRRRVNVERDNRRRRADSEDALSDVLGTLSDSSAEALEPQQRQPFAEAEISQEEMERRTRELDMYQAAIDQREEDFAAEFVAVRLL